MEEEIRSALTAASADRGHVGQIILMDHESPERRRLAASIAELLVRLVEHHQLSESRPRGALPRLRLVRCGLDRFSPGCAPAARAARPGPRGFLLPHRLHRYRSPGLRQLLQVQHLRSDRENRRRTAPPRNPGSAGRRPSRLPRCDGRVGTPPPRSGQLQVERPAVGQRKRKADRHVHRRRPIEAGSSPPAFAGHSAATFPGASAAAPRRSDLSGDGASGATAASKGLFGPGRESERLLPPINRTMTTTTSTGADPGAAGKQPSAEDRCGEDSIEVRSRRSLQCLRILLTKCSGVEPNSRTGGLHGRTRNHKGRSAS